MERKYLALLLLCVLCSIHMTAQSDFYFYKGGKIPLTLNEDKVVVSIPKDAKDSKEMSERIRANVQIPCTARSDEFYIYMILRSDLEKLRTLDFWEEDSKSVIITPSYYTERNEEVYLSPYMTVRLKKEEDTGLLSSYVEQHKLQIVRNSQLMPLWYVLCVTLETGKSPLACANELAESGDFASAEPDLMGTAYLDYETAVRSIRTASVNAQSFFDLQGRRLSGKPAKGVYIENGRKVLK